MVAPGVTLVTVVFEPELPLLLLQARSMSRYLEPDFVAGILVIDNTARGIPPRLWSSILGEYGALAPVARLLRADDVAVVPRATGWNSQQVLKLAIARSIDTDRYITLDAKNHFIRPSGRADFEAPDGRPYGNFHGYEKHPLRPAFERVFRYLSLDPEASVGHFTATATPFVHFTAPTVELQDYVEGRSGTSFAEAFIAERFTEYFLSSAWLVAQGAILDEVYDPAGIECPAVWPKGASIAGVRAMIDAVEAKDPALVSVHRTPLARMDRPGTAALVDFWVQHGLFASPRAARSFVRRYRARYLRTMVMKKIRERGLSA